MNDNEDEVIDLSQLFELLKKNIVWFLIIVVICCTASFVVVRLVLKEEFTATAKIIIVQKDNSSSQNSVTYSDVQLSQKLANTYKQIIMSEAISDPVITKLSLNDYGISQKKYEKIVSVQSLASTEVMSIAVTTNDPKLSADIANEVVDIFIEKIYNIMQIENVSVLAKAKVPTSKSGPSLKKGLLYGFGVSFVLCAIILLMQFLNDTEVKTEEEVKKIFTFPIIGSIPEISFTQKELDDD